jgi:S-DNA-T family DNA segregation ATPase FtsK/SpoIIIE
MIITMSTSSRAKAIGHGVWGYRVEAWVLAFVTLLFVFGYAMPLFISLPVWLAFIGACVYWRKQLLESSHEMLHGAKVRRQIQRAAKDAGFKDLKVDNVILTLPGEWAHVEVPRGSTVGELEKASEKMARNLKAIDLHVMRGSNRAEAKISVIRRDPFAEMDGYVWPLTDAERTNLREDMLFGYDIYGREVKSRMLSRNLLVGGAPDSGKSTFLRLPAAYTALDPNARLWMMDGKRVEFEAWRTCCSGFVAGRDLEGAVEMLTSLYESVDERYREITAAGEVFVLDHMKIDVLMIDELPTYTRSPKEDKKAQGYVKQINELLYAIVAQGRAAGLITILSAQKPDANTVPTEIRDLIDNKFALHCNTKAMSDTILGQGAGEESVANAAEIPAGQPGVGYYVGDHGVVKTKCFYVSHNQAREIASRAASRQLDADLSTLTA